MALLWCIPGVLLAAEFSDDFSDPATDAWHLSYGRPARVAIENGYLVLDMSTPRAGKWASALLRRSFSVPCRVTWRQRLVHDSPYTWLCGLAVTSIPRGTHAQVVAGLGGSGLKRSVFLGDKRSAPGTVKERVWYVLVLELQDVRQRLTVREATTGKEVAVLETNVGLAQGPFIARFFQNDHRLSIGFPDAYDQDRGTTEIDDFHLTAAQMRPYSPPPPGTDRPYKIPVVFNRAIKWITPADGLSRGSIAYDAAGWLPLTGRRAVSRWLELKRWLIKDPMAFPEQTNVRASSDGTTVFRLPPDKPAAVFALRAVQWCLDQHPVLQWRGTGRGVRWSVELTATDGVRPFLWTLWRSGWTGATTGPVRGGAAATAAGQAEDPQRVTKATPRAPRSNVGDAQEVSRPNSTKAATGQGQVDLRKLYHQAGWPHRYIEVDILVRMERTGQGPGELELRMGLPGQPAVVPRAPVVTQALQAAQRGVPLEAIVVDSHGQLVTDAQVSAQLAGRTVPLARIGHSPVYRGVALDVRPGDYRCVFVAKRHGQPIATADAEVAITQMEFADHYDRATRSYCTTSGRALGPLLGDLLAWIPVVNLKSNARRVVCGTKEIARVNKMGGGIAWAKWRVLPRRLIDEYVDYMAKCGVTVIRLTVNVSPAEYYLDACGHVAPHGLEQIFFILSAARRNNVRCVLNLTHYPYLWAGTGYNPPVMQYFEAGYRKRFQWTSDEMWRYLSSYLQELLGFTGQDPAVMAYTVTGENDQHYGPEWINRAYQLIKKLAPRQMVVLEQGGSIKHCTGRDPANYAPFKPAHDGGVGYRTYATYRYPTDCFIAVAARFYDLAPPSYLGEVACGVNMTPQFRTKLRDAMGIALTLQQPMAISWSAPAVECERKALTAAARMIDWTHFRRARPPVAIIVDRPDDQQINRLVAYEEALAGLPLDYEYLRPGADVSGYAAVFDARKELAASAIGEALPVAAVNAAPLRVSPGNHTSYAVSTDRRWMVAYVRNATHYELKVCDVGKIVERCRLPDRKRRLKVQLVGMANGLEYTVLDCASGASVRHGKFSGHVTIDLGETPGDYVIVANPAER